jgi:hypothetical protein
MRLAGKFDDPVKMGNALNLNQHIMEFHDHQWTLGNIVIRIDLNANGHCAMWEVSGPKPVVDVYVSRMNDLARNAESGIYDYGTEAIVCLPTAAFEREEE